MKSQTTAGLGALLILLLAAQVAQAGVIINYGDFVGDTVCYNQVTEEVDIGTYGAPTVSGDTISFQPVGMEANASAGAFVQNDAQLNFDVLAKAGKFIAGIDLTEGGDFTMGGSGGTDLTGVDVTANFFISIMQVDGVAINTITESFSMTFSPNADGTFQLVTDGGGAGFPPYQGIWSGSIYINFNDILASNNVSYVSGTTLANVNLDNILVANSEAGTSALIKKKFQNGLSITSDVVPEPASLVLLVGTTSLLTFIRRRFIG